jgi:hypothetical protein
VTDWLLEAASQARREAQLAGDLGDDDCDPEEMAGPPRCRRCRAFMPSMRRAPLCESCDDTSKAKRCRICGKRATTGRLCRLHAKRVREDLPYDYRENEVTPADEKRLRIVMRRLRTRKSVDS